MQHQRNSRKLVNDLGNTLDSDVDIATIVTYQWPAEFALLGDELPFEPESAEEVPYSDTGQKQAEHSEEPFLHRQLIK